MVNATYAQPKVLIVAAGFRKDKVLREPVRLHHLQMQQSAQLTKAVLRVAELVISIRAV